jgi:3-deoxy-D-manno-octulosonic-acid transferase
MYFLYSLALALLFLALLPRFLYQAIRYGKYASSFKERMGGLQDFGDDKRPVIWVHAVSVGEFNAARPLLTEIRRRLPAYRLVVSTTTMTGQQMARQSQGRDFDRAFYFPFDWAFAIRRSLDRVRPSAVIILETEIWPNFLRECRRRNVKVMLANGRISPRSFPRYLKARRFVSRVLEDFSLIAMQSQEDAERAIKLGAPPQKVRVCGNLKYDLTVSDTASACEDITEQFAILPAEKLIVAGSTAPGEERVLIEALEKVRGHDGLSATRLLVAPRHPERFEEVAGLISQSRFDLARRSEGGRNRSAAVILLDSIGELAATYRLASVVFVGGSLVPRGGHNIIEPAAYRKPIVTGPYTENFRQIVADFKAASALAQVGPGDLADALIRLLIDEGEAVAMGERAHSILEKNRGSTRSVMAAIEEALGRD